jgi:hypothetical protein
MASWQLSETSNKTLPSRYPTSGICHTFISFLCSVVNFNGFVRLYLKEVSPEDINNVHISSHCHIAASFIAVSRIFRFFCSHQKIRLHVSNQQRLWL